MSYASNHGSHCIMLLQFALQACGANYVSPPNPDPSTMEVRLDVSDVASQSDVLAMIQFLQNGNIIRFQSGEVVECNGAALSFEANLFYVGRTPRTPPGGKFNCTYTRSGGSHALSVSVPPRPVITSPVAGSTVMRSSNLTITYAAGGGTSADAGGSHPNGSMSRNQPQPDNGSYTGFDASGFAPGLGTISLTRIAEGAAVGTPFQAARFTYRTSAQIPVTWQ
jgi:hypothetical protein